MRARAREGDCVPADVLRVACAQINHSITSMWQSAVRAGLVAPPADSRLHSVLGRELYKKARQEWLESQSGAGNEEAEKAANRQSAIDEFVASFQQ